VKYASRWTMDIHMNGSRSTSDSLAINIVGIFTVEVQHAISQWKEVPYF
jgi:hypothetical protein